MAIRVLGIGIGLFHLLMLWSAVILTLVITSRARSGYRKLGSWLFFGALILTIVVLSIPRAMPAVDNRVQSVVATENDTNRKIDTSLHDWMHFGRILILIAVLASIILSVIFLYFYLVSRKLTSSAAFKANELISIAGHETGRNTSEKKMSNPQDEQR